LLHKPGPIGTKLKAHNDAGDNPQDKGQREYLDPECADKFPMRVAGPGKSEHRKTAENKPIQW